MSDTANTVYLHRMRLYLLSEVYREGNRFEQFFFSMHHLFVVTAC